MQIANVVWTKPCPSQSIYNLQNHLHHVFSTQNKRCAECEGHVGITTTAIWRLTQRKWSRLPNCCCDSITTESKNRCLTSPPPSKNSSTKTWTMRPRASEDDSEFPGYQWKAKTKPPKSSVSVHALVGKWRRTTASMREYGTRDND